MEKNLLIYQKKVKKQTKNQGSGPWVKLGQSMLRIKGNCQTFDKLMIFSLNSLTLDFH